MSEMEESKRGIMNDRHETTGTKARKTIQDDHHYPPVVFNVCLDPQTQDMNIWTG